MKRESQIIEFTIDVVVDHILSITIKGGALDIQLIKLDGLNLNKRCGFLPIFMDLLSQLMLQ